MNVNKCTLKKAIIYPHYASATVLNLIFDTSSLR